MASAIRMDDLQLYVISYTAVGCFQLYRYSDIYRKQSAAKQRQNEVRIQVCFIDCLDGYMDLLNTSRQKIT